VKTGEPDIYISRKRCPFEKPEKEELFFSLMDYRNNLFTSNDPNKIIEFYDGFENRDELVEWMRERPKGASYIYEVEGNKDIIVVIPTADFNGKYAKECRENIFKGLHMIFVESGEIPDPYFNGAHNVNVGIKRALKYSPKWIIYSGDDMYKIDDVDVLKELLKIDPAKVDIVFPVQGNYHTLPMYIGKKNFVYELYRFLSDYQVWHLYRKFNIKYFYAFHNYKSKVVFKKIRGTDFICTVAFGIFSANYVRKKNGIIFDETFINEHEDLDLSFRLLLSGANVHRINYRIGAYKGSSLGMGRDRGLRQVAGRAYFNYKFENLYQKYIENPNSDFKEEI